MFAGSTVWFFSIELASCWDECTIVKEVKLKLTNQIMHK